MKLKNSIRYWFWSAAFVVVSRIEILLGKLTTITIKKITAVLTEEYSTQMTGGVRECLAIRDKKENIH